MNLVSRRAAGTILAICIAASVSADSYHPHIMKSEVVVLDAKAIEGYANSGKPFELVLGGNSLTVVLTPAPVWPEKGLPVLEIGKDSAGSVRIVQGDITYAGEVEGEDPEESEARFTIAGGVLDGYVLSSTGWWFIEPLTRFDPRAGSAEYLVYATRDLDFVLEYGDDGVKMDRVIAPPGPGDPRIAVTMVADEDYVCLRGDGLDFHERHATLLNKINGIYKAETGRDFRLSRSVSYTGSGLTSTTTPLTLLVRFNDLVNADVIPNDSGHGITHLTTARNLNGDTLGIAQQDGNVGLSQQAVVRVAVGGTSQWVQARMLSYQNMMVAAHEIGHNLSGHHALAEKFCVWDTFLGCLDYERTIMWVEYHPDNRARFSDGTRNPLLNNRQEIIDAMTSRYPF